MGSYSCDTYSTYLTFMHHTHTPIHAHAHVLLPPYSLPCQPRPKLEPSYPRLVQLWPLVPTLVQSPVLPMSASEEQKSSKVKETSDVLYVLCICGSYIIPTVILSLLYTCIYCTLTVSTAYVQVCVK